MTTKAAKKPAPKPAPKKMVPPPAAKGPAPIQKALPLSGKKVMGPKNAPPPAPIPVSADPITTAVPAAPAPEANGHEKPLCWIELVKNGNVFIARSNTYRGASKEYKNRVLEDMLTELILELQEEIQE